MKGFWPSIRGCLEAPGFDYSPEETPKTDFELSEWLDVPDIYAFWGQRFVLQGENSGFKGIMDDWKRIFFWDC